jgi:hypothetical protein
MMLLADCLAGRLSRYSHTCYAFPASVWHWWTENTDVTWMADYYLDGRLHKSSAESKESGRDANALVTAWYV